MRSQIKFYVARNKFDLLGCLLLLVFVAVGSYYRLRIVPYIVILFTLFFIFLALFKKANYFLYLFTISLCLLWQTSMLGIYVVGADIHGELSLVNKSIAEGWDWSFYNPNNTSLIIGWLVPLLSKIGFNPIWQFKLFYPIFLAFVPPILFLSYRKMMEERSAFLSTFFFIIMPVYFLEVGGIVKSMVAEVFLALIVYLLVSDMKTLKKTLFISLCIVLATITHYTIGILSLLILLGAVFISLFGKIIKMKSLRNNTIPYKFSSVILSVAVVTTLLWYSNAGGGCIMYSYKIIVNSFARNTVRYMNYLNPFSDSFLITLPPPDKKTGVIPPITKTAEPTKPIIQPTQPITQPTTDKPNVVNPEPLPTINSGNPSLPDEHVEIKSWMEDAFEKIAGDDFYLRKQEPLVKTAIGMDMSSVPIEGKIFRVFQYLTQFLIVVGLFYVLFSRYGKYNFNSEFLSCAIMGMVLLGLCIFVPVFSSLINVTRYYHTVLFFLAPMLVIGMEELYDDVSRIWLRKS